MSNYNFDTQPSETTYREEFMRQVLFMKDEDKILAVFPFYHNVSDKEYKVLIDGYTDDTGDDNVPAKHEFCLMHEIDFGWGWIPKSLVGYMSVADYDEYESVRHTLVSSKVIHSNFILNEEY